MGIFRDIGGIAKVRHRGFPGERQGWIVGEAPHLDGQLRTGSRRQPSVGPGGGTSAPPERIEEDRRADVDELSDGGAGSARHTGDRARQDGEKPREPDR